MGTLSITHFPHKGTAKELAQIEGEIAEINVEIRELRIQLGLLEEHRRMVLKIMTDPNDSTPPISA